jgi:ABC-type Fe3+/spermidine/putrescine transport system ATPase subunit
MSTPPPIVRLEHVSTTLGGALVMDDVSLDIATGEFFSIIGPSGCGKTTTLKTLGGFLIPEQGTVHIGGIDVTEVPPYRREVNTVFQSYALFGHLSVAENVAFGLKRSKVPKAQVRSRVSDMLDLVDLSHRADAKPADLSGGQRQRVALVRALVNLPKLLLLDEPLGALDLNLRRQMQEELKRVQREVGVSFVYVTHDQEEALSMSDRIAVMNAGRIQQVGSPREMYDSPRNEFVARFLGAANLFTVQRAGTAALVSVRPERIEFDPDGSLEGHVGGTIADASYLGSSTHYRVTTAEAGDIAVVVAHRSDEAVTIRPVGSAVTLGWHRSFAVELPASDVADGGTAA